MKFYNYQEQACELRLGASNNLTYLALGLVGEAGEVAEKVKKKIRDDKLDTAELAKELGDVLWYVTNLAEFIGYDLDEIARINLDKLHSRKARNKLQGSGDNR